MDAVGAQGVLQGQWHSTLGAQGCGLGPGDLLAPSEGEKNLIQKLRGSLAVTPPPLSSD